MKETINIGMFGLGTVGTGVAKLLTVNALSIEQKVGAPLRLKTILVRNLAKPRAITADARLTADAAEIIGDRDIDIVVEVMGGEQPAKDYIIRALQAGKHVVTANKDVMAKYGRELFAAAAPAPVAVVTGREDGLVTVDHAKAYFQAARNAAFFATLPGQHHCPVGSACAAMLAGALAAVQA